MTVPKHHVIGTNAATPELIVQWCLQQWPTDLPSGLVFCVPTSLAMRRLRDALTQTYHAFHGIRFTLPAGLTTYFTPPVNQAIATPSEQLCAWDKVFDWLQTEDCDNLVATWLFPGKKAWLKRPSSRYAIAKRFIQLRATLAEGVLDFTTTAQHPITQALDTREKNRWAALEVLETKYREILAASQLTDATDIQLATFRHPVVQPIESSTHWRLIVACIPDLMPAFSALFNAAPECDILIQADLDAAQTFTPIGTPDPKYWQSVQLLLPDDAIQIAENPSDEALCIERFLGQSGYINPSKICLGLLNHEVMSQLTARFADHDIHIFEPDPIQLTTQPAVRLLQQLFQLLQHNRVELTQPLLSSPELHTLLHVSYADLRSAYNTLIAQHQPTTLEEAITFTANDAILTPFFLRIQTWLQSIRENPYSGARTILIDLFGSSQADPTQDATHFATFEALQRLFQELGRIRIPDVLPTFALLNARLGQITLHPVRGTMDCSYEGRFEVLWSSAKRFVLSGLNEGIFPDTTFEDAFLPNQFRTQLGLRSDSTRLARDAYLLDTLCKRISVDNLRLLCCRVNLRGDWLKPSRLFFRCTPEQRKIRAAKLFLNATSSITPMGVTSALKLPSAPHTWNESPRFNRLSPTQISEFLKSPLTFWIKYALNLKDVELPQSGVPANIFGTLIHHALESLSQSTSSDCEVLETLLVEAFTKQFAKQYGTAPNIELLAAQRAGIKRLKSAAKLEASLRKQGWQTRFVENDTKQKNWEVVDHIDGHQITLYGKIDRIDYNPNTGIWRIFDYKTGKIEPDATGMHYKKKKDDYSWESFQLPIYRLLLRKAMQLPPSVPIELYYFVLPETGEAHLSSYADPNGRETTTLEALRATLKELLACTPEKLYGDQSPYLNSFLKYLVHPFTEHETHTTTN